MLEQTLSASDVDLHFVADGETSGQKPEVQMTSLADEMNWLKSGQWLNIDNRPNDPVENLSTLPNNIFLWSLTTEGANVGHISSLAALGENCGGRSSMVRGKSCSSLNSLTHQALVCLIMKTDLNKPLVGRLISCIGKRR